MYPQIAIGSTVVHTYNLFLLISLIAAALLIERQIVFFQVKNKDSLYIRIFIPVAFFSGFLGSAVSQALAYNGSLRLEDLNAGLTFIGGLFTGFIFLIVFSMMMKISPYFLMNFFTNPLVLAHAFGKIGCFFAGCCFGRPTGTILGVTFPVDSFAFLEYGETAVHPTQLYESAFLFILFFYLQRCPLKKRFYLYAVMFGVFRFAIEYLRGGPRGTILNISFVTPGQIAGLALAAMGLAIFLHQRSHGNRGDGSNG